MHISMVKGGSKAEILATIVSRLGNSRRKLLSSKMHFAFKNHFSPKDHWHAKSSQSNDPEILVKFYHPSNQ